MVKKIMTIVIKIFIIVFICQITNINKVNAAGYLENTITDADKFISDGKTGVEKDLLTDDTKIQKTSDKIYNTLLVLGIVFAVIIGGVLGIQIMWGSIEQQVKAKEMLMPYAIGCLVIFGAFGIWKLVVTILAKL